jgi:TolB protein
VDHPNVIVYTQITETGADIFGIALSSDPPEVINLTGEPGADLRPRWSPDMRYIAYLRRASGADADHLWLIDIPNGVRRAASTDDVKGLQGFSWSPDSRFLIYSADQPNGLERDVYRLDVESGQVVNLTADSSVWDSSPAWSPDGEWIAFVSDRAELGKGLDNVWLMAADGSMLRNVTDSDWEDTAPAWSPDSAEIAFYRWGVYGSEERGPAGLWVTNIKSGQERLLVRLEGIIMGLEAPVWSPDGRYIAYQSGAPRERDIYLIPAGGGETINLSDLAGDEFSVSWCPDSRSLIFSHSGEDDLLLYTAAVDGTDTKPLLDTGGNGLGEWAPAQPSNNR